jgi:alcohol dehydrogenase (NADP+)
VLDVCHLSIIVDLPDEHVFLLGEGAFLEVSHVNSHKQFLLMLQLAADSGIKPWIMLLPMSDTKKAIEAVKKNEMKRK